MMQSILDAVIFNVTIQLWHLLHGSCRGKLQRRTSSVHGMCSHSVEVIDTRNHRVHVRVLVPEGIEIHLVQVLLLLGHLTKIVFVLLFHRLLVQERLLVKILLVSVLIQLSLCHVV